MDELRPGDRITIQGMRARRDGSFTNRCKPGNETPLIVSGVSVTTDQEWISTGKAAKILGYAPDWFARKFDGIIPAMRTLGGHRRWLSSAVRELASDTEKLPNTG